MANYSIFISYAHEDEPFKNALTEQLRGLQRQGLIAPWDDRCINGGDEWRGMIAHAIDGCHLALLLVSPAFIASDFIFSQELSRLLERHSHEGIRVVPIIIKACAWDHEPIKSLQAWPKDAKPIITFPEETGERAQAWTDIVREIAGWAKETEGQSEETLTSKESPYKSADPAAEGPSHNVRQGRHPDRGPSGTGSQSGASSNAETRSSAVKTRAFSIRNCVGILAGVLLLVVTAYALLLSSVCQHGWHRIALKWGAPGASFGDGPPNAISSEGKAIEPTVTFYGPRSADSVGNKLHEELENRFFLDTGIRVHKINPWEQNRFEEAKGIATKGSADVLLIDLIWADELADFVLPNPRPSFREMGLLYYRKDLLERYKRDLAKAQVVGVPKTWKELETAAWIIQEEERKKNNLFRGFIWQTDNYEGLTCNALEWIASRGNVRSNGDVDMNGATVFEALYAANRWLYGEKAITPAGDPYREGTSLDFFAAGHAAFLRGWASAYASLKKSQNLNIETRDIGVAFLPRGNGYSDLHVGALGGWDYAIPLSSRNQTLAGDFVGYLISDSVSKWLDKEGGFPHPSTVPIGREALASLDSDDCPHVGLLRRSAATPSIHYSQATRCFYTEVHAALSGESAEEVEQHITKMKECGLGGTVTKLPKETRNGIKSCGEQGGGKASSDAPDELQALAVRHAASRQ